MDASIDPKHWALPVRHLPTHQTHDHSVRWNNVKTTYEHTLFGQVTSLMYSPTGEMLAATATNHSMLLRVPATRGAVWNEQIPRRIFASRFRPDSRLLLQCVDMRVSLRSTETAFERHFDGHTRDVRDAAFLTNQTVVSASDDATLRFWDVTRDAEVGSSDAHGDYVRSVDVVSEHVVLSGGYDRRMHVWDVRVSLEKSVKSLETPHQVEKVLYIGARSMGAVASGDVVTLFDLRRVASRMQRSTAELPVLQSLSIHSKPVVGLAYSSAADVLITGSFDGRVKFVSMKPGAEFHVEATRKFEDPVTCVAVHPDGDRFAVGTAKGRLSTYVVQDKAKTSKTPVSAVDPTMSKRDAEVVTDRLAQVRRLLSTFQYRHSLEIALLARHQDIIASTLEELQRRGALHVALSGHNDRSITQLLRFTVAHVQDPEMHRICVTALNLIFEIYGPVSTKSELFHKELQLAHDRLREALARMESLQGSVGLLEYVLDDFGL